MNPQWPGVFVSSTCYDLIDLRAELETFLKDLGFLPIMSDRTSSEFEVPTDRNSIDACLVNVQKCETFICVLSQRYGPRLGKHGFLNISATHLEYQAARQAGRSIYLYARDRLCADYSVWRQNRKKVSSLKFPWVGNDKNDLGLFDLLEDHRKLASKSKTTNWLWSFRDSIELKARIGLDLRKQSRALLLRSLLARQDVPAISVSPRSYSGRTIELRYSNPGGATAFGVRMKIAASDWKILGDLPVGQERETRLECPSGAPVGQVIEVRYATRAGDMFVETFECRGAAPMVRRSVELLDDGEPAG
jgi:uncharacterized protein DUF4062